MLEDLKVKCQFFEVGCEEIVRIGDVAKHEEDCEFVSVKCRYAQCEFETKRSEINNHESKCEMRTEVCDKGCGKLILSKAIDEHNCITELKEALDLATA